MKEWQVRKRDLKLQLSGGHDPITIHPTCLSVVPLPVCAFYDALDGKTEFLKQRNCLNGPKQFSLSRYICTHGMKLLMKVQNCSNVYSGQHHDQQHPSFKTICFWICSDGSVLIIIVLSGLKPVHLTDVLCTSYEKGKRSRLGLVCPCCFFCDLKSYSTFSLLICQIG